LEHPTDKELIHLASGQMPGEPRRRLEGHIAACPDCHERLEQFRSVWSNLGRWEVVVPTRDLAASVVREVERRRAGLRGSVGRTLRLAASIAASVLVGIGAGRLALSGGARSRRDVTEREAAQALHLTDFQNGSPGMFAETILGFRPPEDEGVEEKP